MRRPKILLLFALTVLATTFCTGKTESVSSATGTTGTPPATGATSATTTTNGTLPPVKIDMTIIGLATVADAAVTPNEAAKKTVILANQSGHTAMFIMKESNIDTSDTRFHYVGTINNVKQYAFDLSGVQIELANDTWDEKGPVSFSNWGDSTNAGAPADLTDLVQTSSLHWLPNMASVLGSGSYPPLPSYFNPEPSASNVLARIPLRGGTIASLLLKPYWVWRFRNKNGYSGPKQVLAAEVHYTFNLKRAATTFQIYGRKFVTTGAPAPTALPPRAMTLSLSTA